MGTHRHPRQQRRPAARRPADRDDPRAVDHRSRREPHWHVPLHPGGGAGDDRSGPSALAVAGHRQDPLHLLGARDHSLGRPRQLRGVQGRREALHAVGRPGAGAPPHPRELDRPRRHPGLLVAALAPPLGRTLVVTKLEEDVTYDGTAWALGANRWADGSVAPHGFRDLQRFRLDGTTPVWTYACADALLDKRVWMEPGANTTYVRYEVLRAAQPLELALRALVNYRDYHATTRGEGWSMDVARVAGGLRVRAFEGATPVQLLAPGAETQPAHAWYRRFTLPPYPE